LIGFGVLGLFIGPVLLAVTYTLLVAWVCAPRVPNAPLLSEDQRMKLRDSGMPDRTYWESLLDVPLILDRLGLGHAHGDVAELGCGYGTFTVPLAKRIRGQVHAYDIEPQMIEATRERAQTAGCANVRVVLRDVFDAGFDLDPASCDAVLLFNILHGERPVDLLREAARVLRPGGMVAVIHWRTDIETPRGPTADIRPSAAQVAAWAAETGVLLADEDAVHLPPWHYGLRLRRV
jgi:SAM-dependent methyltransferase